MSPRYPLKRGIFSRSGIDTNSPRSDAVAMGVDWSCESMRVACVRCSMLQRSITLDIRLLIAGEVFKVSITDRWRSDVSLIWLSSKDRLLKFDTRER